MEDFQDHYVKKDVLLLADVFEKFISTCLEYYGLDPCHYFSAPVLSWDAMLKMTKVELEKISDWSRQIHVFWTRNEVLVIFSKNIVKQIMNIAKIMIKKNLKNVLSTLTWIIYMGVLWVNIYLLVILNGSKL